MGLQGLLYNNLLAYRLITRLKLMTNHDYRYRLAARYIHPGETVLDVCAGPGDLKQHLPPGSNYQTVEASPRFAAHLTSQNIQNTITDLHNGLSADNFQADVVVMLISLYSFQHSSLHQLLEDFKTIARRRVIIIEEVLVDEPDKHRYLNLIQRLGQKVTNYLSAMPYHQTCQLLTQPAFYDAAKQHGYQCSAHNHSYHVAIYDKELNHDTAD